jgi:hypothetical protein
VVLFVGASCEGVDTVLARSVGMRSCECRGRICVEKLITRVPTSNVVRVSSIRTLFGSVSLMVQGRAEVKSPTA